MRYYAIVHPLSAMKFNSKSRTKKILAATWLIPMVLASPYTFSRSYPFVISSPMGSIARQICNDRFDEIDALMYGEGTKDRFRRGFFMFLFLVIYLVPMVVILSTCVRIAICLLQPIAVRRWPSATGKDTGRRHEENKRKVARMVIVVAVAFILSWSPFYFSTLVSQIQSIVTDGDHFLRERNFIFTMLMIHLCGFLNSCINPFIYTGMSKKFRRSFKMILSGCICCRLKHRFLRYRDSLTRGMSAAFTSSLRHSMTEVRDANDLALNEGGGQPSTSDGSRYSVRSNQTHSSVRASNSNNSLRHHATSQPRHNHHRHHNNMDSSECSPQQSAPLSSHDEGGSKSSGPRRGFKAWKSREQKGTLIELTPLRPQKTLEREEQDEEVIVGSEMEESHRDILPTEEEEKKRFLEEGENAEQSENDEVVETPFKLLPEATNPFLDPAAPNKNDISRTLFTSSGCAPKDVPSASPRRVYPAPSGQAFALADLGCSESAGFKCRDYKAVTEDGLLGDSGDQLSKVVKNGGSYLKDTVSMNGPNCGSAAEALSSSKPSPIVKKKDGRALTNQNGGIVHVDFAASKGHCVQL
ncbi:hypothetical protein ACOMHN_015261 [Nucella lapillus]